MKTLTRITKTTAIAFGNKSGIDVYLFFSLLWGMLSSTKGDAKAFTEMNLLSANDQNIEEITDKVSASELVHEINKTVGATVCNLPSAVDYYNQLDNVNDPTAEFMLRLLSGKTGFNMEEKWTQLQNSGLTGADLVLTFWDEVSSLVKRYTIAFESPTVMNYLAENVTKTTFDNGVVMITVKGDVELSYFELLALEGHLIKDSNNEPVIITFEITVEGTPSVIGFTPFFGNTEAVSKFNNAITPKLNEAELLYTDNAEVWTQRNDVTSTKKSFILAKMQPEVVNNIIEDITVNIVGEFKVNMPISVN